MRSYFDYTQSRCTRGSFVFCHKHSSLATMLAFFPNRLDLPDRVTSNLLDGFRYFQGRCTRGSVYYLVFKSGCQFS
jgi:hypothetical protein